MGEPHTNLTGGTVALSWLITRLLTLGMLLTYAAGVVTDLNYYRNSLQDLPGAGLSHTLVEYPLPTVAVVAVPRLLAGSEQAALYIVLFVAVALAVDAAFTCALFRAGKGRTAGLVAWLGLVPALGALTYTRFDLLPGVLVGLMLLLHRQHGRAAALALALATAVKLWPALLLAPLVAAVRRRRHAVQVIGVVALATVSATLALGGWSRLWSPLTYQGDRGLQIESLAATPLMVWRWLHPGEPRAWFAPSKSWELTGPGVEWMLTASTVATVVLAAALLAAWWKALATRRPLGPDALVWLTLSSTTGFLVAGRVLSPQYLLWLAPVAAAGLVVVDRTRAALRGWTTCLGLAAVLTNLLYPLCYTPLLHRTAATGASVMLLGARNGILLALLVISIAMAWRSLRDAAAGSLDSAETPAVPAASQPSDTRAGDAGE